MSYILIAISAFVTWFIGGLIVGGICMLIDGPGSLNKHSTTSHVFVAGWNVICFVSLIIALIKLG